MVKMISLQSAVFCIALHFIGSVHTLSSIDINVPKAVLNGHDVELLCHYELEGDQLYSIRWYINMMEFYRYVPKESPATKVFPIADMRVDIAASDQNRVVLTEVGRPLTGEYQCEVSADAPRFHTDIKSARMVVVEPPLTTPHMMSDNVSISVGEVVLVNCSAPPSFPAANITWSVNNEEIVPLKFHVNNITNGFASSFATLRLKAPNKSPLDPITIRCVAWIYDVWSSASDTLVLSERSPNPVSALGRSLTGSATETIPATLLLFLQLLLQLVLERHSDHPVR